MPPEMACICAAFMKARTVQREIGLMRMKTHRGIGGVNNVLAGRAGDRLLMGIEWRHGPAAGRLAG
jgi:hypothetical protein